MSKLVQTVAALQPRRFASIRRLSTITSQDLKEMIAAYLESFYDKVENDTLTFREAFTIVLAGAVICQLVFLLGCWLA